jgi:hypothetical protein
MAHFAEIDENNIVLRVVRVENDVITNKAGIEDWSLGVSFLQNLFGGRWIQTSYNASFRKHFAGVGFAYDPQENVFVPPKPFESWNLNTETFTWHAPVPQPGDRYFWDEKTQAWVEDPLPEEQVQPLEDQV